MIDCRARDRGSGPDEVGDFEVLLLDVFQHNALTRSGAHALGRRNRYPQNDDWKDTDPLGSPMYWSGCERRCASVTGCGSKPPLTEYTGALVSIRSRSKLLGNSRA